MKKRAFQEALNFKNYLASFTNTIYRARYKISREKTINLLILSSSGNSKGFCYPFSYYREELFKTFNLEFREHTSDDISKKSRMLQEFDGDIALISMPHRINGRILPKQQAINFFQNLSGEKKCKLVYLDVSDSTISPYFDLLPYVDLFLMHTTFKNPSDYQGPILGGNIIADYLSKRFKIEPNESNEYWDDLFCSHIPEGLVHKVHTSWNAVLKRRLVDLFEQQQFHCVKKEPRSIDVLCRVNPYSGWCRFHRTQACKILTELAGKYRIVASINKIGLGEYTKELEDSKIMFSPFGWGEICPKDFEAMAKGCLLIKPSMEHIKTYPPLYVANETYVPVSWDLADLQEKVIYYLENESERIRIIEGASKTCEAFFRNKGFLRKIEEVLTILEFSGNR